MASSVIAFPTTDAPGSASLPFPGDCISPGPSSTPANVVNSRAPLLPFRRISLPTLPVVGLLNRQSVVSLASVDSLPEEDPSSHSPGLIMPGPKLSPARHPGFLENRRFSRRRDTRQLDDAKASKRRKIVTEFYETERAYVDGLDLIYSLFLTPIIASLDTSSPILERTELTAVFSNFIDIWNLHRSFFSLLTSLLSPALFDTSKQLPALSPLLLSHFPYLSLYTPFITAFPDLISAISDLSATNPTFSSFIRKQEANERCGKLKLRDWLLTIVQRCPRYLLLLKDLIGCTNPDDAEYTSLIAAHALVSKITNSLNTSLQNHSQTLALLALQRTTPNLPFRLIHPGRTLLKRGPLTQIDHSSVPKPRDFLLFSDCLIWLANDKLSGGEWGLHSELLLRGPVQHIRPDFIRTRSKSENEIPFMKDDGSMLPDPVPYVVNAKRVRFEARRVRKVSELYNSDEKWVYKGKIDLVDLEVVVNSITNAEGDERRLELLSPEGSFAVYALDQLERDEWASAIRSAKASLFVSLNFMHPNSTLTSSASTNHLRRTLQALPYSKEDEEKEDIPKRGRVDHFVPAVWVPDGKTDGCMRCGKQFNWRWRRHHCRLCGRCVCASCSERTFFISDYRKKGTNRPARACNACYETVFPVLVTLAEEGSVPAASGSALTSLPSLRLAHVPFSDPEHPMMLLNDPALSSYDNGAGVWRKRRDSKALSYLSIPPEFQESRTDLSMKASTSLASSSYTGKNASLPSIPDGEVSSGTAVLGEEDDSAPATPRVAYAESIISSAPSSPRKNLQFQSEEERFARNRKRFSLPAIALQTTQVTTRPNAMGEGRSKRYSLILGMKSKIFPGKGISEAAEGTEDEESRLKDGVAAARLAELLRTDRLRDGQ